MVWENLATENFTSTAAAGIFSLRPDHLRPASSTRIARCAPLWAHHTRVSHPLTVGHPKRPSTARAQPSKFGRETVRCAAPQIRRKSIFPLAYCRPPKLLRRAHTCTTDDPRRPRARRHSLALLAEGVRGCSANKTRARRAASQTLFSRSRAAQASRSQCGARGPCRWSPPRHHRHPGSRRRGKIPPISGYASATLEPR